MAKPLYLASDGTLTFKRMAPLTTTEATKKPAIRLGRLRALLSGEYPSICVVRGEGIGDVIMTLPTIHALKNMFDNVSITYATNIGYLSGVLPKVLKGNPDISEVIDRNILDETKYDIVINLHCPAIFYEKTGNPPINRIDLFANHAGVKLIDPVPHYIITGHEIDKGKRELISVQSNERLMLVHLYGSESRRSFDPQKIWNSLRDLYRNHNVRSAILLHSSDHTTTELWNSLPGSLILKDKDIREIAGVMVHCDLVLCPDSSILHLAGSLGIPTVALFGSTDPRARINYYKNTIAIWKVGSSSYPMCPCWYINNCSIGEICWKYITTEDITTACLERLQNASKLDINALLSKKYGKDLETRLA